jgi:hypothetical protein
MKNKPDLALSGGSYLFIEIKKRTPKSHQTISIEVKRVEISKINTN